VEEKIKYLIKNSLFFFCKKMKRILKRNINARTQTKTPQDINTRIIPTNNNVLFISR